jgi:tRNA1(Val) A37 N6-methylase TrmN6
LKKRLTKKSEHTVLDGRLLLRQPVEGYRAAIDPVLLASSVPAHPGQSVLDLGTGIGTAALCLAATVADVHITALELQSELVDLAIENTRHNGFESVVQILEGDINNPPAKICEAQFDHVMANPPYYRADQAQTSPNQIKALANVEGEGGLCAWLVAAHRFLKEGGVLTIIHTADRLADLVEACNANHIGSLEITPFWPKAGRPARRIILRGRKGGKAATVLNSGFLLHKDDGSYTDEADEILKGQGRLDV